MLSLLPFGLKMMLTALLDTGFNELRSIVISAKYTTVDLAMYENGRKYPNLISTNLNASIGSVMFPAMSKQQADLDSIKLLMKKSMTMSMFLMAPAILGFMAIADRFVLVVLTEKWLPSVPYIYCTCVMCLFYPIHTVNIQALNSIGRSERTLLLEAIKKVLSISVLIATMFFGVFWIAVGAMVVSLLSTIINATYSKKYFNYSILEQLRDVFKTLCSALVMFAIVFFADSIINTVGWLQLIVDIAIGVVSYVVI